MDIPIIVNHRTKTVITRKPHVCAYCGRTINVGESADTLTELFDGEANRQRFSEYVLGTYDDDY